MPGTASVVMRGMLSAIGRSFITIIFIVPREFYVSRKTYFLFAGMQGRTRQNGDD